MYLDKPSDFNAKFEIVSCFCENNGKILLLHRQDGTPQANTWGVPAGKVKDNEDIKQAMIREILEETGISFSSDMLTYFSKVFVRYSDYDFVYHIFSVNTVGKKIVKINPKEHKGFRWVTPENALNLPLVPDLDDCIKLFFEIQ